MSTCPSISVVMAVYNGEAHLREAVESVLDQSFEDFEFVVVDDGSVDATASILEAYARRDPRVRIHRQNNAGLTRSLNVGLALSRAEFVARLDADDICRRDRLEKQLALLRERPDLSVAGSWAHIVDSAGVRIGSWQSPAESDGVFWRLIFGTVLPHSSALIRRTALKQVRGYSESAVVAQDYDLWTRIVQAGGRIASYPDYLVSYRRHERQIRETDLARQERSAVRIADRHLRWLLECPPGDCVTSNLRKLLNRAPEQVDTAVSAQTCRTIEDILRALRSRICPAELDQASQLIRKRLLRAARKLAFVSPSSAVLFSTLALRMNAGAGHRP